MSTLATSADLVEDTDPAEALMPLFDEHGARPPTQSPELIAERRAQIGGGLLPVAMRSPDRFGNDAINDPQTEQVRRRDPHEPGGLRRFRGVPPQNGRAAFRRDHGVDRVLEQDPRVAAPDGGGPPAAPSPGHDADDRRREPRHLAEVLRDGL